MTVYTPGEQIHSEAQHAAALAFVENLFNVDDIDNPLFEVVAANLKDYESTAPEWAAFNARYYQELAE